MRIGLFDSGLGGLTVLKKLKEKYPKCDYIYYGDNLNVPYGDKTIKELIELANNSVRFLLSKNVDIIIIACGTISSNCLSYLKDKYNIPIIDIISPTINYLNNSNYNNILVIATKATISSGIFKNNVKKNIYELETPLLAPLIENNNLLDIDNVLHSYLDKYVNKIDSLVLGCTHYPIIISNINKILNKNIKIIDMSNYITLDNFGNSKCTIYYSKLDDKTIENTKKILNNINYSIENSK